MVGDAELRPAICFLSDLGNVWMGVIVQQDRITSFDQCQLRSFQYISSIIRSQQNFDHHTVTIFLFCFLLLWGRVWGARRRPTTVPYVFGYCTGSTFGHKSRFDLKKWSFWLRRSKVKETSKRDNLCRSCKSRHFCNFSPFQLLFD